MTVRSTTVSELAPGAEPGVRPPADPSKSRVKQTLLLTLIFAVPIVAMSLLLNSIATSVVMGPKMDAPAMGQGAGETGGANALGEALFGGATRRADRDASGTSEEASGAARDRAVQDPSAAGPQLPPKPSPGEPEPDRTEPDGAQPDRTSRSADLPASPEQDRPSVGFAGGDFRVRTALASAFAQPVAGPPVGPSAGPSGAQPGVGPEQALVRPESLPQGFTIVIDDASSTASRDRPIHLALARDGWNPANPAHRLTQRPDGQWTITLTPEMLGSETARRSASPVRFRLTLGSWTTRDRGVAPVGSGFSGFSPVGYTLAPIDSNVYPADADGDRPEFSFVVFGFEGEDADPQRRHLAVERYGEVSGDIRRLEVAGGAGPTTTAVRDLLVWLPEGYDQNPGVRYPVLYLFDGQRVFVSFEDAPAWNADAVVTREIAAGAVRPMIVVAVTSAESLREAEYIPVPRADGSGDEPAQAASGQAYAAWFVRVVMPAVERAFRVSTDPADTAVGGGGVASVMAAYLAVENPRRIGKLLVESPPELDDATDGAWRQRLRTSLDWPTQVSIGAGSGDADDADWARELDEIARNAGVPNAQRRLLIEETGSADERGWGARLGPALRFLFPAERPRVPGD